MSRTAWLAVFSLVLASGTASDAIAGAFGGADEMAGGFGGADTYELPVRIEMDGGQTLEGRMLFRPLLVDSDLGRYEIQPDKIKTIRFLAPLDVNDPLPQGAARDGRGNVVIMQQATIVLGKVITTSGKEVLGAVHIPVNFKLQLEFGTLTPSPEKLRAIMMIDAEAAKEKPLGQQPSNSPNNPRNQGQPKQGQQPNGRQGNPNQTGRQRGGQQGQPNRSSPSGSNGSQRSPD